MQGKAKARWLELCEQAAVEQDPAKLLELVKQINDLLSAKQPVTALHSLKRMPSFPFGRCCVPKF